jgi:tRNA modification GTPase
MTDVVFALATAPGRAAVAVVRLSGEGTGEVLARLAGPPPPPRRASLRRLKAASGETLDQALVFWLPGPASYTGEDCAELHLHGGPAVVDAVTGALLEAGARPAEAGEFTRRAFERGRLDLSEAEAVADLVDAETEGQRRQALAQLGGALARRHEAWRASVLAALTVLEAAIDFPDEEVPEDVAERARPHLQALERDLAQALADAGRGETVREGLRVALIGAPNAGKSSLMNRLLEREAAIVTAVPGTTRDVIEAPVVVSGFKVLLADMAGVREAGDAIEAEGVRRARAWAEAAALRLWVVDGAAGEGEWRQAQDLVRPGDLLVLNKADLAEGADAGAARAAASRLGLQVLTASAATPVGCGAVAEALEAATVRALTGQEFPAATRARHRARLQEALEHVRRASGALDAGPEYAAEDLRLAGRALGRITGRIDPEEILGAIFASFCIGK